MQSTGDRGTRQVPGRWQGKYGIRKAGCDQSYGSAGFTLIEIMIALVIVGLLAAIALPRLSLLRDNAHVATLKSDLRNFSQAEESYFYDHAVYTAALVNLTTTGYQTSPMVTVTISEATATGWSATADHQLSNTQCALFIGSAAPVGAAVVEGRIACN